MLFRLDDIHKSYGSQDVLCGARLQINPGEKVGLVGRNGAGKTTLLRIIAGLEQIDRGEIIFARNLSLGFLQQEVNFSSQTSVLSAALEVFAEINRIEERMRELEHKMQTASGAELELLLADYSDAQHDYERKGGFSYHARAESVLLGLGFTKSDFELEASKLSGGQQNRLALARLLLREPDILLLDEPTNHLDITAIEWLEEFLLSYRSAYIVISHDRFFLDRVVTRIIELDRGRTATYTGNYSAYVEERERRRAIEQKRYEQQQEFIARTEDFIRRNIAGQKTKQAKSRRRMLERLERLEAVSNDNRAGDFRLKPVARTGDRVLVLEDLSIGFPTKRLAQGLSFTLWRGECLGIVGPNGSGKTTLARTILGKHPPLSGEARWGSNVVIGYYDQQLAGLDPQNTVIDELRQLDRAAKDGELRAFLGKFLFTDDDPFKPVAALSGGEKGRLALAKLIYSRANVLVLDEPTNHLDIPSREALESALDEYTGTMLVISHDRYFLDRIASQILYLDGGAATFFDGTYSEFFEARRQQAQFQEEARKVEAERERASRLKAYSQKPSATKRKARPRMPEIIESEIAELESEISSISEMLASKEAAQSRETVLELSARYEQLNNRLSQLYVEWEETLLESSLEEKEK